MGDNETTEQQKGATPTRVRWGASLDLVQSPRRLNGECDGSVSRPTQGWQQTAATEATADDLERQSGAQGACRQREMAGDSGDEARGTWGEQGMERWEPSAGTCTRGGAEALFEHELAQHGREEAGADPAGRHAHTDAAGDAAASRAGGACAGQEGEPVVHTRADADGHMQGGDDADLREQGEGNCGMGMPPVQAILHVLLASATCARVPRETGWAYVMRMLRAGEREGQKWDPRRERRRKERLDGLIIRAMRHARAPCSADTRLPHGSLGVDG